MWTITEYNMIYKIIVTFAVLTVIMNVCGGGYRLRFEDLEKKYKKGNAKSSLVRE